LLSQEVRLLSRSCESAGAPTNTVVKDTRGRDLPMAGDTDAPAPVSAGSPGCLVGVLRPAPARPHHPEEARVTDVTDPVGDGNDEEHSEVVLETNE
jgi:hypothetical protein